MRGRVDAQARDLDHVVGELRRPAAHHRLDSRQQLPGGERLGDVVVGAAFQRGHLVLLLGARGEQHDGDVLGALVGAQPPREGEAGHARQHPVEQHEVGARVAHQRLRRGHVACAHHLVARALQVRGQKLSYRLLIIDDEDRTAHGVSRMVFGATSS
ncbi:hypothetical protein D3C83_26410 [compost metagenome]